MEVVAKEDEVKEVEEIDMVEEIEEVKEAEEVDEVEEIEEVEEVEEIEEVEVIEEEETEKVVVQIQDDTLVENDKGKLFDTHVFAHILCKICTVFHAMTVCILFTVFL